MDREERKRFWEMLCSLQGNDLQKEYKKLKETIRYPQYLYRYRSVSLSSIDALQRNRMYLSNANYYDDPFDTLLQIDFNSLREEGMRVLTSPDLEQQMLDFAVRSGANSVIANNAIDMIKQERFDPGQVVTEVIDYIRQYIQTLLKSTLWSACFTESGDNETMWLKYADQYKGFCIIYDLSDSSKDLCGSQEKCNSCVVNNAGVSLYPVYYSNDGYDATDYAKKLAIVVMLTQLGGNRLFGSTLNILIDRLFKTSWEQERVALIKSKCHEYDQEWRMLLHNSSSSPVMKEWIPYGIILGLRMMATDKDIVIRSSKMAGVEHIYESYINDNYRIAHRELVL